jgi:exopolysaccharide production protein ExoZ
MYTYRAVRTVTTTHKLPGIQILRAVAAICVLSLHAGRTITETFPGETISLDGLGDAGVDIFFVISGFIMFHTSRGDFGSWQAGFSFMVRRIVRIVPLYWLFTFLIFGLQALGLFFLKEPTFTLAQLAHSIFFISVDWPLLGAGWTLNYEMYFYLIFAFCLSVASPRSGPYVIIGTLCAIVLVGQVATDYPPPHDELGIFGAHFFANTIAIEFCFGILLAKFAPLGERKLVLKASAALVGAAILLSLPLLQLELSSMDFFDEARFVVLGIPAALLVFGSLAITRLQSRAGKVFLLVGDASYSIYLTHRFVLLAFERAVKRSELFSGIPPLAWMPLLIAVAIAVGVVTFFAIERPMTRFLQGRLSPRRPIMVAA